LAHRELPGPEKMVARYSKGFGAGYESFARRKGHWRGFSRDDAGRGEYNAD